MRRALPVSSGLSRGRCSMDGITDRGRRWAVSSRGVSSAACQPSCPAFDCPVAKDKASVLSVTEDTGRRPPSSLAWVRRLSTPGGVEPQELRVKQCCSPDQSPRVVSRRSSHPGQLFC